jgi:hypothetical protein
MPHRQRREEQQPAADRHSGSATGEPWRNAPEPSVPADKPRPSQRPAGVASGSGPALGVRAVIAAAARTGQRQWWRILTVALVVSVLTALVETVVDEIIDPANVPLSIIAALFASGVSLLGAVFLSGFLCRLVGESGKAGQGASIRHVARTLAWGRLVGADLLVALLVIIGLIALVIPGLIAINLFAIVGPVIDLEDVSVLAALRRSAHLVRQHFWKVALLVTLPVAVASEIEAVAPDSTSARAILEALAIRGLGEALVEAAIGLVTVQLCYRLLAQDRVSKAAGGRQPGGHGL